MFLVLDRVEVLVEQMPISSSVSCWHMKHVCDSSTTGLQFSSFARMEFLKLFFRVYISFIQLALCMAFAQGVALVLECGWIKGLGRLFLQLLPLVLPINT